MINDKLVELYQRNWDVYEQKIEKWEADHSLKITNPLCLGVQDNEAYVQANFRVMIFGQETNGWCDETKDGNAVNMQNKYLSFYQGSKFYKHKGQFKNGFNYIVSSLKKEYPNKKIEFIWNNIIKRGKKNGKGRPPQEVYSLERNYFDVIREEIEILKPDIIVFFTGPYYDKNIRQVFNIEKNEFTEIKGFTKRQLATVNGVGVKLALRTYHPNYLYRVKGVKKHSDYFNTIISQIKNSL